MRQFTFVFIVIFWFIGCSSQMPSGVWRIEELTTNYVSKGPLDIFELPNKDEIIGKDLIINNDTLVFAGQNGNLFCNEMLVLGEKFEIAKHENKNINYLYPGDELVCLNEYENSGPCYVSQEFMALIDSESNHLEGYILNTVGNGPANCKLFLIKNNHQMVFFSENDFLILKLSKVKF